MNEVAASEFELLSVIRGLFDPPSRPPGLEANIFRRNREMPPGLGPTALRLAKDSIAKGLVLALIRRGGWRHAESLQDGQRVSGRLWERHPPPEWHVSPFAMHLCRWLVSEQLQNTRACDDLDHSPATIADQLILYLALDLTRRAGCSKALVSQPAARASALCWLGFADVLIEQAPRVGPPADISVYAFAPWMSGTGAVVLEALQDDLAARWIAMERDKRRLTTPPQLLAVGQTQSAVLEACFSAADGAQRRDLCGFAINATRALLAEWPDADSWQPSLQRGGSLQSRSDARRAKVSLPAAMARWRRWVEHARSVRFFDDDYDAAQLTLRMWEPLGDHGYQHVEAIVRELSAIDAILDDPEP